MRLVLLCLSLFLLLCPLAIAQNYVYPVATGISWSIDLFHDIEQDELTRSAEAEPIEGAPHFAQLFATLSDNYLTHNRYNDSIFYDMSHQEWISMFIRRAHRYSDIYASTNDHLSELKNYFSMTHVPDAAYDSVYFWTRHLYHRNISDIYMFEQLLDILVPHYEARGDAEHLIFCYLCAGHIHYQSARMGDLADATVSMHNFMKVMALAKDFARYRNPLNRYYILAAFVDLAILHTQAGNIPFFQSRQIVAEMEAILAQDDVKALFDDDDWLRQFADWSLNIMAMRSIIAYISHGVDDPTVLNQLYHSYVTRCRMLGGDFSKFRHRYYAKLEYDDLLIEAFMGHITWDDACDRFERLLEQDPELATKTSFKAYRMNYMNNLFASHLYIINHTSMSRQEKAAITKRMLDHVLDVITHFEHIEYPFEKGQILTNIATNPDLLQYLDTREKNELFFRLLVVEQPTTYVHVTMVAALARTLTEGLIHDHPEYFVGLPGLTSVRQVRQQADSLLNFVYQAAIFHDIGKISMPWIVNNCLRRLTDHEYNILKMHPEKSAIFFRADPWFQQYEDVAMGHHKWYNGRGYPASFRNQHSRYYPIINIVTLCDCMDAATENIGRNYHTPKSFEVVMGEFSNQAGTQIDPLLVRYIYRNKKVYRRMKQTVLTGRFDHYYELYRSYMIAE